MEEEVSQEGTNFEVTPDVVKVLESPPKLDKGKGLMIPASSGLEEEAPAAAEVARHFVRLQARHRGSSRMVVSKVAIEVPPSLEGLDPCFSRESLVAARAKGRERDFARVGMDLSQAFDPVPNVVNLESILFDESDIENYLVEAMMLAHDRHAMYYSDESTTEFVEKVC